MDLHVENTIKVDIANVARYWIDPYQQNEIDDMFGTGSLPYVLDPGRRILMSTVEIVTIGEGWCGLICLRSTWARLGLISPPTIADPGFSGTLTMELYNSSQSGIQLQPMDAIWSMTRLLIQPGSEDMYQGRYQGQRGVTIPKALRHE